MTVQGGKRFSQLSVRRWTDACMEGGRALPPVRIIDLQERDASGGLADAQPGTFGLHITAGEHAAPAPGLDVVSVRRRASVIGGRARGQRFERMEVRWEGRARQGLVAVCAEDA